MRRMVLVAAVMIVGACAQETPSTPQASDAPVAGGIELQALVMPDDTAGRLGGELSCSFMADEQLLLLASGIVASQERSEALIKRDDAVVEMTASEPGGYDTLGDGETFAADGLTVEVRTGAENATGGEEVEYNATLTARDGAGGERAYEGTWICGP